MESPPEWLAEFSTCISASLKAVDLLAPIGCHYFYSTEDELWEVTVFVSSTEVVGGEYDGRKVTSRFFVDVGMAIAVFEEGASVSWQALPMDDEDDEIGPHISIDGVYQAHHIWLRIPSRPPEQFESGRKASPWAGLHDVW